MAKNSVVFGVLVAASAAHADVTYVVRGVDEALEKNVLAFVDTVQLGPSIPMSARQLDEAVEKAIDNARIALRPYGYYAPDIRSRIINRRDANPVIQLTIDPGPPVRVSSAEVRLTGPGSTHPEIMQWQRRFPIRQGNVLDQTVWEDQKRIALEAAESQGYLAADFSERRLDVDLERNRADLRLELDTGERFVMGDIKFGEHVLKPGIVEQVPRFETGDPYTERLMDRFRTDLWKTGYFDDVEVVEERHPDADPPYVDLDVTFETLTRNRYSGALGFGTGSGMRAQVNWLRSPVSSNGDRIDLGLGWQELDDRLTLRGVYRLPRREKNREDWFSELVVRRENLDVDVKREQDDENSIKLARGDSNEQNVRFGREKIRYFKSGDLRLEDIVFLQFLNSVRRFDLIDDLIDPALLDDAAEVERLLNRDDQLPSIGIELNSIDVRGRSFETVGHRERAWAFHSNDAFGSNVEFTQIYLSARRSSVWRDDYKLLLRAELGYTDADVAELTVDTPDGPLSLSITELPNFYRFKAGGSYSVRGYGFEELSDNGLGSNNIVTASVEGEYRFLPSWSAAAFIDVGNAFNDWSKPKLKRGVGVGIRWYSFVGEIRLDVAQALDFEGDPWHLHLTIGTPLL